jgi:hypothetical protein
LEVNVVTVSLSLESLALLVKLGDSLVLVDISNRLVVSELLRSGLGELGHALPVLSLIEANHRVRVIIASLPLGLLRDAVQVLMTYRISILSFKVQ